MSGLSGISFSGLASGLDTAAIIRQLVLLERRPIGLLKTKRKAFDKQNSLFTSFEEKLKTLEEKAKDLRLAGKFLDFKADTNNTGFLAASAGSNAVAGTYKIKIESLAASQVRTTQAKADKDTTPFGGGDLIFTVGGQQKPAISTNASDTLQDIANKINATDDLGVQATIIDVGGTPGGFKLVLTAEGSGTDGTFTLTHQGGSTALQTLVTELSAVFTGSNNFGEIIQGTNAKIDINGISVERSSNSFADLIGGVTLNLTGKHATGESTTVTVSSDATKTGAKVKAFVDAYNDVVEFIQAQQKVTPSSSNSSNSNSPSVTASPLLGDSSLLRVQRTLRTIMGSTFDTGNNELAMLVQIGIKSEISGKLTFSQTDFEEALVKDEAAVKKLFTDKTNGIAKRIFDSVDTFTDSVDGIIKTRKDGIGRIQKDIDRQIRRLESRIKRFEEGLRARFASLEVTLSRLQSQAGALLSIL